jgi:hypothetical protein
MYQIKVEYETGDSFHKEDTEDIFDEKWANVDVAKENLQRIKNHYAWVCSKGRWSDEELPRPDWHKVQYPGSEDCYVNLLRDNREEFEVCASWIGHFETLYGASIISDPEDGWSFRID